jgi:LPS-assembly lipoprotein
MRRLWLILASSVLLLSACGFHLKGEQDYAFKRLYISAPAEMQARMRRLIEGGSDTVVVADAKDADATLTVTESSGQRTLTLNLLGVAQEYELVSYFSYRLSAKDGRVLIAPSTIRLNRSLTYSDQFYLAKSTEADLLYSDMRSDAADQLVRRLSVVRSFNSTVPAINPRGPLPTPPL